MKIASIVGARPQFIKLAPFSREIRKKHQEILIDTGQHYDDEMAANFYSEFQIPKPDHSLGVGSGSHAEQTGRMLVAIERVLLSEKPAMAVVFGDTNSTIAGAMAAAKLGIPVAHVEAGLRSFDKEMPEEINRIVTDHLSSLLFCPTETSRDNLEKEGITEGVHIVGDIMLDALMESRKAAAMHSSILQLLGIQEKKYQLLTCHRPSNTDIGENLIAILNAVSASGELTIFPVHPRTMACLKEYELDKNMPKNIIMTKPLGHMDTIWLIANAKRILTDSGGMQKEAYVLGTPCLTLRETTEWVETVRAGWNMLVGANSEKIEKAIANFSPPKDHPDLFGPVGANVRMVAVIDEFLSAHAAKSPT